MKLFLSVLVLVTLQVTQVTNGEAVRPYMGWSSWSSQATTMPGMGLSWLNEGNILRQIDSMADKLKDFGYTYINLDSGWNANYDWQANFDKNGIPSPDPGRFPRGIKFLADYAHSKGLKLGIYAPVGLPMSVFGEDQSNKVNFFVLGSLNCTGYDLVYSDWRSTNGWDSSYKIDFTTPCAQLYIDSNAARFAEWGIDFFKLDGVGPGSWKDGPNYDNRDDVAAWRRALNKTGREVILEISWSLEIYAIDTWKEYANGWRIDTDVECYCDTLVRWDASVVQRFTDLPPWIKHAGPGRWNDLDTLNVGNGTMDGISEDERKTYATLWAISCAPLYIGEDLTLLDDFGMALLANREVIDINQNGMPAKPVTPYLEQQVWWSQSEDSSFVVALFNLGESQAEVEVDWRDLGFSGTANVRDIWSGEVLGNFTEGFRDMIPTHGTRLIRVQQRLEI